MPFPVHTFRVPLLIITAGALFSFIMLTGIGHAHTGSACTLSVAPASITAGDQAVLSWDVGGGTFLILGTQGGGTIDNGIGLVPASGSRDIFPTQTTTYTLTVSSTLLGLIPLGTVATTCSATVQVGAASRCIPTYTCAGNGIQNSCNGIIAACPSGASCVDGQCVQCGAPNIIPQGESCDQTYTVPGTYTYTAPSELNFNGMTVTVNGAGGGGGGGACTFLSSLGGTQCTGEDGSAGGDSSFGSAVVGRGGTGGPGAQSSLESIKDIQQLFGGPDQPTGAAGIASGGDTNTTGGGAAGGDGSKTGNVLLLFSAPGGGDGGNGGRAVKHYAASDITPGSTITVVVGDGGQGGTDGNSGTLFNLFGQTKRRLGGDGSDGSVTVRCQ